MTSPRPSLLRVVRAVLMLLLAAGPVAGCFDPFGPRELGPGISAPPPAPDSPSNVLRLLEWTYNNRAISEYREIFTDDYRFLFSLLDPYGNAYRDNPWTREDELASATHLFQGGHATEPPASSITLTLDRNFRVEKDPRPGKNARWHTTIRTSVALTIVDPAKEQLVTGFSNFFLVRGDSAVIPQELIQKGFGPDSTRWYIERWEDDTATNGAGGSAAAARPSGTALSGPVTAPAWSRPTTSSWGRMKVIYR